MAALDAKLVAIVGPSASGKSALALRLALARGGEIVSCDSLQVYRGLDIGSAKPSGEERELVPHHLIDVVEPDAPFSAAEYARLARIKGKKVRALDQDFVPEDSIHSVLGSFNQMYGHIFRYMVREVGPIAENVLEKYLGGLRETRKDVFAGVKLQKDGTLDPALLEKNLNRFPEDGRRGLLVDGLNELLYAELLAVKRTLGAEHEATIIKALREK